MRRAFGTTTKRSGGSTVRSGKCWRGLRSSRNGETINAPENMQTIAELTTNALTEISGQPTKGTAENTQAWEKWFNFQTFADPQLERLVDLGRQFASAVRDVRKPFWFTIVGKSGCGKTHIAKRLSGLGQRFDWSHTRYATHIIYWPEFIEELRERVRLTLGMEKFHDVANWPFLVLDDIGAERDPSGFAVDKLNTLLNIRVGRWTVITSNLNLEGLSKLDDRIASRIVREPGNLWIEMDTLDYGLRPKT